MKTILKLSLVSLILLVNADATPSKVDRQNSSKYDFITILDNGVKREAKILKSEATQPQTTHIGLIIRFKSSKSLDISAFEKKYNLELEKKLLTGFYIFNNLSSKSDNEILREIIESESDINSIRPNWKMKMKAY